MTGTFILTLIVAAVFFTLGLYIGYMEGADFD